MQQQSTSRAPLTTSKQQSISSLSTCPTLQPLTHHSISNTQSTSTVQLAHVYISTTQAASPLVSLQEQTQTQTQRLRNCSWGLALTSHCDCTASLVYCYRTISLLPSFTSLYSSIASSTTGWEATSRTNHHHRIASHIAFIIHHHCTSVSHALTGLFVCGTPLPPTPIPPS